MNTSSSNIFLSLEQKLDELNTRRVILEGKNSRIISTYSEFQSIRNKSNNRISNLLDKQRNVAKQRNVKIVEEVQKDRYLMSELVNVKTKKIDNLTDIGFSKSSAERLFLAKKMYYQQLEINLPIWRRHKTLRLEEKIKDIRLEKNASMQRREKIRLELLKEDKVKCELEQQRRDLYLSLALEHKEMLESKARDIVLKEEGRLVDLQIMQSIENYNDELCVAVEQRLSNPHLEDYLHIKSPKLFDPPKSPMMKKIPKELTETIDKHRSIDKTTPFVSSPVRSISTSQNHETTTTTTVSATNNSLKKVTDSLLSHDDDDDLNRSPSPRKDVSIRTNSSSSSVHNHSSSGDNINTEELIDDSRTGVVVIIDNQNPVVLSSPRNNSQSIDPTVVVVNTPLERSNGGPKKTKSSENMNLTIDVSSPLKEDEFEPINLLSTASQSSTNKILSSSSPKKTFYDGKESCSPSKKDDDELDITGLEMSQCLKVLKSCFSKIETDVLFTPITSIYPIDITRLDDVVVETKISRTANRILSNYEIVEDSKTLGSVVFKVIQSNLGLLVPKEAFSGVVTIDKLRKEYKKIFFQSGVNTQEMWDVVISHLQHLVEVSVSHLEHLSKVFTSLFTSDVLGEDRDRLHRKISKLLQIAMIPSHHSGSSRSPSPVIHREDNRTTTTTEEKDNNNNTTVVKSRISKYKDSIDFEDKEKSSVMTSGQDQIKFNKPSEFDDDEILADESIEKPPPVRDLDLDNSRHLLKTSSANKDNPKGITTSDSNDEFDF